MTHDKARELFSAYSEGTLDKGLTRALEQKLDSDLALAKEYAVFDRTLRSLSVLRTREIEIPADLGERISARLDKHIWDSKQRAVPAWQGWARGLGFSAAAAAVVIGTMISLQHRGTGPVASGMVTAPGSGDQISLVKTDSGVRLRFSPSTAKTVSIFSEPDHRLVEVLKVNGAIDSPLVNSNAEAGLLRIEVDGTKESIIVALPGQVRDETARHSARQSKTKSTLEDMAGAIATFYSVPVELQVSDPMASAAWNFKELDAHNAASKALDPQSYTVDQRDNGFISIQNN